MIQRTLIDRVLQRYQRALTIRLAASLCGVRSLQISNRSNSANPITDLLIRLEALCATFLMRIVNLRYAVSPALEVDDMDRQHKIVDCVVTERTNKECGRQASMEKDCSWCGQPS